MRYGLRQPVTQQPKGEKSEVGALVKSRALLQRTDRPMPSEVVAEIEQQPEASENSVGRERALCSGKEGSRAGGLHKSGLLPSPAKAVPRVRSA